MNIDELARAYVEALNSQPDGLGQHKHPSLGHSHQIMGRMWREFGRQETEVAISAAMK